MSTKYRDLPQDTRKHESPQETDKDSSTKEESSDFQFVNITTTPRISKDSKSLIRVQVMKNFHRRKQKRKSSNGVEEDEAPSSSAMPITDLAGHVNKFRLGPWGLQQRPTPPRAPRRKGGKGQHRVMLTRDQEKSPSEERTLEAITRIERAALTSPVHSMETDMVQGPVISTTSPPSYDVLTPDDFDPSLFLASLEDTAEDIFLPEDDSLDIGGEAIELLFSDPGTGYKDPFDTTPLLDSSWTQFILYYSNSNFKVPSFMMNLKLAWLSMATKDEAYFHALISQFTAHFSLIHQRGDPMEALTHRMEAVKLVNARLGDPDLEASDGTVSAVACMANYEAGNGTLVSVQIHMNGLEQMVKMRGGLDAAGFPIYLQRKIAWADINSAAALGSSPMFPPLQRPNITALLGAFTAFTGRHMDLEPFSQDVSYVFTDLRRLSHILASNNTTELKRLDSLKYSDWLYCVKRVLIDLSNCGGGTEKQVISCISIAALILVEVCLRGISLNSRIIDRLVTREKTVLEQLCADAPIASTDTATRIILLWAHFVCGTAATTRAEYPWYVGRVVKLCDLLDLHSWEDLEAILEDVWWHSTWGLPYVALWGEIETARVSVMAI
ncbi:hypothetical protein AOQ84DRAFT_379623 [Glonium stellatum]|uniref:Tachykinin family protein n=1 Tax=Glonium stellatum TaxID=574774 RepID=A0A8E2JQJ8_9PEZI|nr:hypothetical protein AOQ84DRAFT_379623 [Glonium stellatum]